MVVHVQDDTAGREMSPADKRAADFFWRVLLLARLAIPFYICYALYLWWTLPPSAQLSTGMP